MKSAGTSVKERTVLEEFLAPEAHTRPMARMWFPDAGAGADENDFIEKQILELAGKGFGGVEVGMLMTFGVRYTNEESRVYGWGTQNWIKLLKKVLKAAEKVPGGFQVDMTITGHWPPVLNTIDPNDDAANKEISYSVTPITAEDLESGSVQLALPLQKTDGPAVTSEKSPMTISCLRTLLSPLLSQRSPKCGQCMEKTAPKILCPMSLISAVFSRSRTGSK